MYYENEFFDVSVAHKLDLQITISSQYLLHSHKVHEILLFLEGDCEYIIGNKKYTLKPYDMLFIPAGEFHHVTHFSNVRYERVVINFSQKDIPVILENRIGQNAIHRNIKDTPLLDVFKRLDDCSARFSGIELQYMYKSLIGELLLEYCNLDSMQDDGTKITPKLTKIIYYIVSNLDRDITAEELCKEFFISKSALYKLFTDNLNISLMKYIRIKRITLAQEYITEGMGPSQVYQKCGFNDYCTFYRAYRSIVGEAPSAKKRENK